MTERTLRAATVVLHRDGRVFLVERPPEARFFPAVWAFPGGKVDGADGDGADAFARGAVRELAEETGLAVEAARLVPAGRLLTPPFGPVRFDTQFFALALGADEDPQVDGRELVEAVDAYERGRLPLAPPTLAVLRILAAASSPEEGAARMAATDGRPHAERFRIEVHPGVFTLPLATRTLPPATTTNVVVYAGERVLVVDPGSDDPASLAELDTLLAGLANEGKRVAWIALTHHHGDHVGGALHVRRRWGGEIAAHPATARRLPFTVERELADGARFDLGTHAPSGLPWEVEALHTPGHAPGHLAFVDLRWRHVAAGDLVSGVSTILVDPDEGDMAAYLASLERLVALAPAGVLPAHGPPAPGARLLRGTLEHRRMREALVLEGLAEGLATVEALLPKVYADADPALWPLAARNLESHLRKLEREGRARREGAAWRGQA